MKRLMHLPLGARGRAPSAPDDPGGLDCIILPPATDQTSAEAAAPIFVVIQQPSTRFDLRSAIADTVCFLCVQLLWDEIVAYFRD